MSKIAELIKILKEDTLPRSENRKMGLSFNNLIFSLVAIYPESRQELFAVFKNRLSVRKKGEPAVSKKSEAIFGKSDMTPYIDPDCPGCPPKETSGPGLKPVKVQAEEAEEADFELPGELYDDDDDDVITVQDVRDVSTREELDTFFGVGDVADDIIIENARAFMGSLGKEYNSRLRSVNAVLNEFFRKVIEEA